MMIGACNPMACPIHVSRYIYSAEVDRIIGAHDPSVPLFMYVAPQDQHGPEQTTPQFQSFFNRSAQGYVESYQIYNGMGVAADSIFGNMTAALKAEHMYNNTLIIMSSDNGGPAAKCTSGSSSNNFPLRGGKLTEVEGGIRVSAFVSGGLSRRRSVAPTVTGTFTSAIGTPRWRGLLASTAPTTTPACRR